MEVAARRRQKPPHLPQFLSHLPRPRLPPHRFLALVELGHLRVLPEAVLRVGLVGVVHRLLDRVGLLEAGPPVVLLVLVSLRRMDRLRDRLQSLPKRVPPLPKAPPTPGVVW